MTSPSWLDWWRGHETQTIPSHVTLYLCSLFHFRKSVLDCRELEAYGQENTIEPLSVLEKNSAKIQLIELVMMIVFADIGNFCFSLWHDLFQSQHPHGIRSCHTWIPYPTCFGGYRPHHHTFHSLQHSNSTLHWNHLFRHHNPLKITSHSSSCPVV